MEYFLKLPRSSKTLNGFCKRLIFLLTKDWAQKAHSWFQGTDWDNICEIEAAFILEVKDELDTQILRNFMSKTLRGDDLVSSWATTCAIIYSRLKKVGDVANTCLISYVEREQLAMQNFKGLEL
ncbi:hypothetical protein ACFE04_026053 [Oxalis oulophora]